MTRNSRASFTELLGEGEGGGEEEKNDVDPVQIGDLIFLEDADTFGRWVRGGVGAWAVACGRLCVGGGAQVVSLCVGGGARHYVWHLSMAGTSPKGHPAHPSADLSANPSTPPIPRRHRPNPGDHRRRRRAQPMRRDQAS